jgi:hypothetical protein
MDPDQALKELRECMREMKELIDSDFTDDMNALAQFARLMNQANRAVDVFDGLDEWVKKGGFLPKDWAKLRE